MVHFVIDALKALDLTLEHTHKRRLRTSIFSGLRTTKSIGDRA